MPDKQFADSDLVDFLSGLTEPAINFSGSADLHTPIHPLPYRLSYLDKPEDVNFSHKSHAGHHYSFVLEPRAQSLDNKVTANSWLFRSICEEDLDKVFQIINVI